MRNIVFIISLLFFALRADAQTTDARKETVEAMPMLSVPVRDLNEIPFAGKEDDILFITPNPHFDKKIVTIDVMPQAGAFRINFPEP